MAFAGMHYADHSPRWSRLHRATLQHVAEFQHDYDVITFDPRGIGQSRPIRCAADLVSTREAQLYER
jgi:pimeloyl-ACP methyl ester carboxylesterase